MSVYLKTSAMNFCEIQWLNVITLPGRTVDRTVGTIEATSVAALLP
jgi:hypothetical protein